MFKGITLIELAENPQLVQQTLDRVTCPTIHSWREMENPFRQFVWSVRPPGRWAAILRYGDWLFTSDPNVPLEVDWAHVYRMLGHHRAALICRLSEIGLIAVAVQKFGDTPTPLMPGFTATGAIDLKTLDAEGIEQVAEQDHDWPEGLLKPEILHLQTAHSLQDPAHRQSWLEKCDEGLWLLTVTENQLKIFEVLS